MKVKNQKVPRAAPETASGALLPSRPNRATTTDNITVASSEKRILALCALMG